MLPEIQQMLQQARILLADCDPYAEQQCFEAEDRYVYQASWPSSEDGIRLNLILEQNAQGQFRLVLTLDNVPKAMLFPEQKEVPTT